MLCWTRLLFQFQVIAATFVWAGKLQSEPCRGKQCASKAAPQGRNVDLWDTYRRRNDESAVFCHPDSNGYFGSTTGESLVVKYSFGLEFEQDNNSRQQAAIFQAFSTAIEDFVLGFYFPTACVRNNGDGRFMRQLKGQGRGFRFLPVLGNTEFEECRSTMSPTSHCGIYEGSVQVFGKSDGVLERILEYLNGQPNIHPQILRIFAGPAKIHLLASNDDGKPAKANQQANAAESRVNAGDTIPETIPTRETVPTEPGIDGVTVAGIKPSTVKSTKCPKALVAGIATSSFILLIGIAGLIYGHLDRKKRLHEKQQHEEVRQELGPLTTEEFFNEPDDFTDISLGSAPSENRFTIV